MSSMFGDTPLVQGMIGGLGPWELGIVLVIVIVIFGAGKLPKIGSSAAQAIKNFKKELKGADEEKEDKKDGTPNK